ncbi:MAG: GTPase ObgE [Candidatus Marinimicrobia bacterium]|nr:GTPase ObgE [Candidatus Neomarinimicrobiota bacterium]
MRFIDFAKVTVRSGKGGDGIVAFRREKYVAKGGPNGGDGGKGGDVIIKGDVQLSTLQDIRYHSVYKAENGKPGQGSNKSGKNGKDTIIRVPLGTIISNSDSNDIITDITEDKEEITIVKGGNGGWGNQHFATSTNQAPRYANDGKKGEAKNLNFELKVLADVGLVGFPNAGKSTLLSVLSTAKPKIAMYPFTTLIPNLGIVKYGEYNSFVMADIPGLIKGASHGKGLGDQFLRHVERTKILIFLIDINEENIFERYKILDNELNQFSSEMKHKPRILCISKIDTVDEIDKLKLKNKIKLSEDIIYISSVARRNLDKLVNKTVKYL